MRFLFGVLLSFMFLCVLHEACAADAVYPGGAWVVVKQPGVYIENNGSRLRFASLGETFAVTRQEGDQLWIGREGGFLRVSDVVLYENAHEYFTKNVEKEPNSPTRYWERATFLMKRNQLDDSIRDFGRGIELAPRESILYIGRGNTFRRKGEYERAVDDYRVAVKLAPGNLDGWNGLGLALHGVGDYRSAVQQFERAIDIDPDRWYPWNNRGNSYVQLEDYERAVADYTEAMRLSSRDPMPVVNRADTLWKLRKYSAALADYQAAIELSPSDTRAYINRGYALAEVGCYSDALADYTSAVRHQPTHPQGFFFRGWLLATCPDGRYRDGALALSDATILCGRSDYRDPRALKLLAAALAELGRFPEAVQWQKTATDLAPDKDKSAYADLLSVYEKDQPYRQPVAVPRPPVEAPR